MTRYRFIRWKDQWDVGEPVVWLDVAKADAAWRRDGDFYIPKGATDQRGRYVPSGVRLSDVSLEERNSAGRGISGREVWQIIRAEFAEFEM